MEAHVSIKFFRVDISENRQPIHDIANSLSLKPDGIWVKGGIKGILTEDSFSYKFHYPHKTIDYIEYEIDALLKKAIDLKPELDEKLGKYDVQLSVSIYTKGQINPGIHLSKESVSLLKQLNGSFDIDIYVTDSVKIARYKVPDSNFLRKVFSKLCL